MSKRKAEVTAPKEPKAKKEKGKKEKKPEGEVEKKKKEKKEKKEKHATAFLDDALDLDEVPELETKSMLRPEKGKKVKKEKKEKKKKEEIKEEAEEAVIADPEEMVPDAPNEDEDFWNDVGQSSQAPGDQLPPEQPTEQPLEDVEDVPMEADDATEQADDIAPDPEVEALRAQEAEEAELEVEPSRPRVLQLKPEEKQMLEKHGSMQLALLRRCCQAKIVLEEHELQCESPGWGEARLAELAARCLLASNVGQAVHLRVIPEAGDLPEASLLEVPSGGVNPKDLRKFGDVVAAFLKPKEPLKLQPKLTAQQAEFSRQLGISVGQAVEVRYADQWFHATVVGFTHHNMVKADYFRTDGSQPEGEGGEVEVGAADVRVAQTARPVVLADGGTLLLIGERRARQCARLHAAAQAERHARAMGHGDLSQSLAERLLELESSEEEEIRICSVDLETGCVHRLQQATQLTEALVEILPGGRRALLCGDFEERQQARCLLELLPKGGTSGDLASIPMELQEQISHLLVPSAAVQAVREKQKDIESETGTLLFWLPFSASAPRRRPRALLPKGAQVEAQYRGAWHGATVVASGEEGVQISWDYDGSLDEVEADQVREKGKAARCHWLRSHRFLVILGALRPRLSAVLRCMRASEEVCPGLWSSEEALEEAQAEVLDGHDVEDVGHGFEAPPLAALQLEAGWLLGLGEGCLAAVERAAQCAVQVLGARLMLAAADMERERAKEYVQWAQQSRKGCEKDLLGLRGGGRLSVMDADMREDIQVVLLSEVQALWLSAERLCEVERETKTLLLFDTGGGSLLRSDMRRLLVCGGSELLRMEAAARVRDTAAPAPAATAQLDPWAILSTMPWPQCINDWGQLQKTLWPQAQKLKPGWIRCMSRSQKSVYFIRLSDNFNTFDPTLAIA